MLRRGGIAAGVRATASPARRASRTTQARNSSECHASTVGRPPSRASQNPTHRPWEDERYPYWLDGDVAAFICYSAVRDSTDRDTGEIYLSDRFGITLWDHQPTASGNREPEAHPPVSDHQRTVRTARECGQRGSSAAIRPRRRSRTARRGH